MCARVRVCLCECVFKRKIGRNGEQLQSGMDGWIAGERHTSSIITRKHTPPPVPLFQKPRRQASSSTDREEGWQRAPLCSYFHFRSLTAFTSQPERPIRRRKRGRWGGENTNENEGYSAAQICWVQGYHRCLGLWVNPPGCRCAPCLDLVADLHLTCPPVQQKQQQQQQQQRTGF